MSNRTIAALAKQPDGLLIDPKRVKLIVIDSFCGAGGFTQGVETAVDSEGYRVAVVIVGINHDKGAIESHAKNHPETVHFVEDIRDKSLPKRILAIAKQARKLYPNAKLLFHASLECTNFSNAKGGKPRDADSRSLAEFMPFYLKVLRPDIFTVENVREFMSWGPLGDNGKPISRKRGEDYVRWYQGIEAMGYRYDFRLHNTADYGANTSRTRYFAQFIREGIPMAWPEPTHAKDPEKSAIFGQKLQKWRPIRECLELEDKGRSIFRNPPLSPNTYERIFEGLVRHVGNGDRQFLSKYFTGTGMNYSVDEAAHTITAVDHNALVSAEPFMAQVFAANSKGHNTYPSSRPARTITTQDGHALVTPQPFAMTYYSGSPQNRVKSMEEPALTLTTENRIALVSPEAFCVKYHGTGDNTFGSDRPCSTLTTTDRVGLVQTQRADQFVSLYYSNGQQEQSVNSPAAALTTIPKHRLVSAEFIDQQYGQSNPSSVEAPAPCLTVNPKCALVQAKAFVYDPQWNGHSHSLEKPSHTIIARQDKSPSSLVSAEFITQRNGGEPEHRNTSLDEPARTVTTTGGNLELVSSQYVMDTHFQNVGTHLGEAAKTITADRHWSYLVTAEGGVKPVIIVHESDCLAVRKIKAFMAEYGIVDILMRMLKVQELKLIQGFPAGYVLLGSQTDQKKYIGNSVPPKYVKKWIEAIAGALKGGVAA
ncbi:DNA cytosine methyltransferase [Tellurirhabdus bombi]|uniref:DNA cytosine methyltransferase n=1 Tax=Tellurirhabdus bombi TaxID=2907205 RepID=UPI001F15B490|nr:DNA cytosine methyltransferase [Tellurirhabdus bombi]